jgi:hypothetical protein
VTVQRIELSDESKQALVALDRDVQTMTEMQAEMLATMRGILNALAQEVVRAVPTDEDEVGVDPFAEGAVVGDGEQAEPHVGFPVRPAVQNPNPAVRTSPYSRTPRIEQVRWLLERMSDGEWHSAVAVGRSIASDERELRYFKAAIGTRMRELWEEGRLERRNSDVKGSMFEYRIVR